MDELRESSLLFSLESLMETERERVQREAREAQKRREEELARVAELAERRRISVQQEREARERRQALEQERERLEQERLEAMKRATVERARIETESRMRLVEAEQARKHELELSRLREQQGVARYRMLTWLSSGALLASLGGALVGYWALILPAQAGREQHLQSIISTAAERAKTTELALSAERSKNQTLLARLQQLDEKPEPAASPTSKPLGVRPPPVGGRGPSGGGVVHGPCVDDGDPLQPCLGAARRPR